MEMPELNKPGLTLIRAAQRDRVISNLLRRGVYYVLQEFLVSAYLCAISSLLYISTPHSFAHKILLSSLPLACVESKPSLSSRATILAIHIVCSCTKITAARSSICLPPRALARVW